jgi:hypothetical protein
MFRFIAEFVSRKMPLRATLSGHFRYSGGLM